jgi:hypothetical protein
MSSTFILGSEVCGIKSQGLPLVPEVTKQRLRSTRLGCAFVKFPVIE